MSKADLVAEVPEKYLRLLPHERVLYSPSVAGDLYTGPPSTLEARTALAALTGLVFGIYQSQQVSELAESWRKYNVGSAASMYNFATGQFGFMYGFNVKPEEGKSSINLHAEQIAIAKGRRHGLNRMVAIALLADPLNDDANPNGYATLRPCGRCVAMFEQAPEVDHRTLILGSNPDFSKCELYTVGSLVKNDGVTLTDKPFALQTEEDFEYYDHYIQPYLIEPIYELYATAA